MAFDSEKYLKNLSILDSARKGKVPKKAIGAKAKKGMLIGAVGVLGSELVNEEFGYNDVSDQDLAYMAAWCLYESGMPPSAIERVLPVVDESVNYKGDTEPVWLYQPIAGQKEATVNLKEALKQIIIEVLDGE